MRVLGLLIPWSFLPEGCPDALLLGAVSSEMPWLVAVKTISGGWTILHCVVSILPSSLTSVSLGPTQVHWDRYVIKGPGGIGQIKHVVPVGVC